ncbi:hypothetical protein ACB092_04G173200 [Castanea dentata]
MFPVNEFSETSRTVNFLQFPSSDGIVPTKLLSQRKSFWRFLRFPRLFGIEPVSEFLESEMFRRAVQLPISGGIWPERRVVLIIQKTLPFR